MIALIDSDILVYRIGFTTQETTDGIALARLRETFGGILDSLGTRDYQSYLTATGKGNYRFAIYPEYKANRKDMEKPVHYDLLRQALLEDYGSILVEGQEADDQIGIDSQRTEDSIIVSIDKDLNQLPGWHYNFVKGLKYKVTPEEGLKYFYHQLLTGDRTDNIPGLTGIGEKKAAKALAQAAAEEHLFKVAREMYKKEHKDTWESIMLRNGRLLKIRQKEDELWEFPDVDVTQTNESATSEVD